MMIRLRLYICIYMKQECERRQQPPKLKVEQCENHKAATTTGNILSLQSRCKCCNRPFIKTGLGLCFKEQEIFHLGEGAPLFFRYLLVLSVAVLIPTAGYSVITLIANLKDQFLQNQIQTYESWPFKLSNISSLPYYNQLYSYILAGCVGVFIVFIPIAAKLSLNLRNKICGLQNNFYHIQPLSVLFKLDKAANYSQQEIQKTINQWYEVQSKIIGQQFTLGTNVVEKIFFHFNAELYDTLKRQLQNLEDQKQREQKLEQHNYSFQIADRDYKMRQSKASKSSKVSQSLYSNKQSSKTVFVKMNAIESLRQRLRKRQLQKTNKFIVVFKKLQYAEFIKSRKNNICIRKSLNSLIFPNENIANVEEAPFPRQVLYQNQHMRYRNKIKMRVLSWLLTVIIIALGSGLQFGLLYLYAKFGLPTLIADYASIFIAIIFTMICQIGCKLSTTIVHKQNQPNFTHEICSINKHKLLTNLFLRSISVIVVYNLLSIPAKDSGGLMDTATWIMFISVLLLPFSRLLNIRIIKACSNQSKVLKKIKKLDIQQSQANALYEKPDGKQYEQYAELTGLAMASFVYGSIVPITLLVGCLCIMLCLFIERICFVYIYKQPQQSSDHIFVVMISILWKSTLLLVGGHLYLLYLAYLSGYQPTLVLIIIYSILLGIILFICLIPPSAFKLSPSYHQLEFKQIKQKIIDCYSQFNPVYCFKMAEAPPTKSAIRVIAKSQLLQEELHTMSKTLQTTLRQKLFNKRPSIMEGIGNHDENSELPFEYDQKVKMPDRKPVQKQKVPPIFKMNRQDIKIKKRSQNLKKSKENQHQLIKLTNLIPFEQEEEGQRLKYKIKQSIKGSIEKIH